jgi:hypothetical protein
MRNFIRNFILLLGLMLGLVAAPVHGAAPLAKDSRIAIIGAGASGLTAAYTLRQLGYNNVVVYEKDPRVGGKVYSVPQADQIFEVGAFWAGKGYPVVDELAQKYGVKFQNEEIDFTVRTAEGKDYSLVDYLQKTHNPLQLAGGFINWKKVQKKYNYLLDPGAFFTQNDPDLALPFSEFVKKYHIEVFAKGFRPFWIGCGYGYYEETPALYVLKLMLGSLDIKVTDLLKAILPFGGSPGTALRRAPEGYQQIWVRLAEDLGNVRTGQEVRSITRYPTADGYAIDISTEDSTESYDALIISTDPKTALNFLDADTQEQRLFDEVQSYRYVIHLFEAEDLPYKDGTMIFLDAYGTPSTISHATAVVNREKVPHVWTAGQLVPWEMPLDDVTDILRQDVADLGGRSGEIYQRIEWNYFPYVSSESLRQGFYQKLAALQGQKSTWYVGGLMNFETVEHTAAFAKQLVEQEFRK